MDQVSSCGLDLLKEVQKYPCGITAKPAALLVDGIVRAEDFSATGQFADTVENIQQIFTIGMTRIPTDVKIVFVPCPAKSLPWAADPRWVYKLVVFQETNEDATEHPRRGDLGDVARFPVLEVLRSTFRFLGCIVFRTQSSSDLGQFVAPLPKIGLKLPEHTFQIRK
jgi:hypothetical protein